VGDEKKKHNGNNHEEGREAEVEIGLSLGDFFKGLGNFVKLVGEMEKEGKSEITRRKEVRGPGRTRAVYGYTVRLGLGGKPALERFGNIREDGRVDDTIEPLTDVFDEEDQFVVILEMPGVDVEAINVQVKERILTVEGRRKGRHYEKKIILPSGVDASSLQKSYRNGILELKFKKRNIK
jgi:HSP20 family protein